MAEQEQRSRDIAARSVDVMRSWVRCSLSGTIIWFLRSLIRWSYQRDFVGARCKGWRILRVLHADQARPLGADGDVLG